MSQCTEADVQRLLSVVPPWRCEQALRYKHLFGQWTSLKAWEMLFHLPLDDLPCTIDLRLDDLRCTMDVPLDDLPCTIDLLRTPPQYNPHGKPFYPEGPEFSISHCKAAVAVAIDTQPVGIDVESLRHVEQSLIERTMNLQEQAFIATADDPVRAFTHLWTQKEAILKYHGTGIVDDLYSVLDNMPKNVKIDTFDHADYVLSVAHEIRV